VATELDRLLALAREANRNAARLQRVIDRTTVIVEGLHPACSDRRELLGLLAEARSLLMAWHATAN
jgi:hypothetical protein